MSTISFSNPRMRTLVPGVMLACATLALSAVAIADEHHERHEERHDERRDAGPERFAFHEHHEHDVRRFADRDFDRWRGGHWANTCHGGRCGWWWLAGGFWYFYTAPMYPYPVVVSDIFYVDQAPPVMLAPPVVAAPPPAPVAPPPAPPPTAQVWYYCDNPAGYYPYVQSCPTQFRAVPANPVPPAPPPVR